MTVSLVLSVVKSGGHLFIIAIVMTTGLEQLLLIHRPQPAEEVDCILLTLIALLFLLLPLTGGILGSTFP
jgi:hypothetical protein